MESTRPQQSVSSGVVKSQDDDTDEYDIGIILRRVIERLSVLEEFTEVEYGATLNNFLENRSSPIQFIGKYKKRPKMFAEPKTNKKEGFAGGPEGGDSRRHEKSCSTEKVKIKPSSNPGETQEPRVFLPNYSSQSPDISVKHGEGPSPRKHQKLDPCCERCFRTGHVTDYCPLQETTFSRYLTEIEQRRREYSKALANLPTTQSHNTASSSGNHKKPRGQSRSRKRNYWN